MIAVLDYIKRTYENPIFDIVKWRSSTLILPLQINDQFVNTTRCIFVKEIVVTCNVAPFVVRNIFQETLITVNRVGVVSVPLNYVVEGSLLFLDSPNANGSFSISLQLIF